MPRPLFLEEPMAAEDDTTNEAESADERPLLGDVADEGLEAAPAGEEATPSTLGYLRFVYAAFFGFAILSAFLFAKAGQAGWHKLSTYKPAVGEPHDEYLYPAAAVLGALLALYYWRRDSSRTYIEEVAAELAKVTWPTRKEVTNATTVVVVATLVSTVFFALMDQFWRVVTDKVYGI
jgi:preprotein translocase subunit SecE